MIHSPGTTPIAAKPNTLNTAELNLHVVSRAQLPDVIPQTDPSSQFIDGDSALRVCILVCARGVRTA
ncbi:Uncharacterised protein [Mycobacteroides abscessus subsp. massiliense]|nr:Uncharacterised protein [Mycobacteroides abscessus subsp. massiliense]SKH81205.1 Uncharacterised protein [Mycobacteroides abscessus subsp. massiliense]SKI09145.1 Uncharacterised protein [Mycobacteroides abscessus subsp. massiliense]SKK14688.1 Uncharacterised protein [Mycobacteroides abscessus subsp. massiliense]